MVPRFWLTLFAVGLQIRPPAPTTLNTGRASIEGVVVRAGAAAGARQQLPGVAVELRPGSVRVFVDPILVTTGSEGAFVFRNLPPGRYTISVKRDGVVPQEDPGRGLTTSGLTVTLTAGLNLKNVVIPLIPAPAIAGQVFAPHGEPLAAALVQAYRRQYTPYGPQLKMARKALTNDMGQFRLFGLNFGEYLVSAGYSDRDRAAALGNTRLSANVSKPDDSYATVFYGGALNISQAEPVRLAPGSDPGMLTINIDDAPRFNVRGRVVPNAPSTRIVFAPAGSNLADSSYFIAPDANGQFEIRKVSPGSYALLATADGWSSDVFPVAVRESDVTGLAVPMSPVFNVTGRVTFEGRSNPNIFRSRVKLARSAGIDQIRESPIASDGSFRLAQVGLGDYDILIEPLPPDSYVKNIFAGGRDILSARFRPDGPQPLQIVLGAAGASVAGRATKAGDPAGGVQIVLVPEPSFRRRADRYITGHTDDAGAFELRSAPPGRYIAYAFEQIEAGAYYAFAYSSEANARFADRGVLINVASSGATSIELKVIPAVETAGGLR